MAFHIADWIESDVARFLVLSTTLFVRAGLRAGVKGTVTLTFATSPDEGLPVTTSIDTTGHTYRFLEFSHASRNRDALPQRYRVQLETSVQQFGGLRWWFMCPRTARRCTKLICPGEVISFGVGMVGNSDMPANGKPTNTARNAKP